MVTQSKKLKTIKVFTGITARRKVDYIHDANVAHEQLRAMRAVVSHPSLLEFLEREGTPASLVYAVRDCAPFLED